MMSDGISEDIITGLSKLRWFFVIARNSSFAYKGKTIDVKRAARDLGVRYVLEGSVRRAGNRVRITAQLIDASTGGHVWADRYDGDLTHIFALQDEITKKVVAAIEPRARGRGCSCFDSGPSGSRRLGAGCAREFNFLAYAARAAELDGSDPWANFALGQLATMRNQTDTAVHAFQRALELNPNFAAAHGFLGYALVLDGQSEPAMEHLNQALSLSPHDPQNIVFMIGLGLAHYQAGRYNETVKYSRNVAQQRPEHFGAHRQLCASLAQTGRADEARATLERLKQLQPNVSLTWVEENLTLTPKAMTRYLDGLRKAGLE